MLRARLRHFAGLALFAMLALALVPSLSHALQPTSLAVAGLGVCSAPGSQPAGAPDGMHAGHCPLCSHALDGPPGMPATDAGFAATTGGAALLAPGFALLPPQRHAWASSQARAPPASSR